MKNKFLNSISLVAILSFGYSATILAQSTEDATNAKKKDPAFQPSDKLEQRNQYNGAQSSDPTTPGQDGYREKPHRGGKQNFQPGGYGRPGWKQHRFHQRFHSNNFYGQGGGRRRWGQHRFDGRNHRDFIYGRRSGFRDGVHFERFRSEMKGLKEQIWKDGIMDLKERDMLHYKMKSFRNGLQYRNMENGKPGDRILDGKTKDH